MSESNKDNLGDVEFSLDDEEDEFDNVLTEEERIEVLESVRRKKVKDKSSSGSHGKDLEKVNWEIPDFERSERYLNKLERKLKTIEPDHEKAEERRLLAPREGARNEVGFYDYAEEEEEEYDEGSLISKSNSKSEGEKKRNYQPVVKRKYYTTEGDMVLNQIGYMERIIKVLCCGYM